MSTTVRLGLFAAALVAAFGAAWGIGNAVDPLLDEPAPTHETPIGETPSPQTPDHETTDDHDD